MPLRDDQIERYSRQIILPELGGVGQERLLASAVRLAGERALVEWSALYLAAAGIGRLWVPDSCAAVAREVDRLDRDCRVTLGSNAVEVDLTVALNASDEFDGRLVIAHAEDEEGWLSVVVPSDPSSPCSACLRVVPAVPAGSESQSGTATDRSSPTAGTAGPTTDPANSPARTSGCRAVIALLSVTETLKLLLDLGTPLVGRRLVYDAAGQTFGQETVSCAEGCKTRSQRRVSAAR